MTKFYEEAKELFGEMRNLTLEEQEEIQKSMDKMFKPTGINLYDILEEKGKNDKNEL